MAPEPAAAPAGRGRRIQLRGTTQGVGLRPFIHRVARELDLTGSATNTGWGVEIEAYGRAEALEALTERLRRGSPGVAAVEAIDWEPLEGPPPDPARAPFHLGARSGPGPTAVPLAPDLAVCPACLAEVRHRGDRRHRYPFTSCTACGPRFSLARELPWERSRTSMADFPMCADCRREYETHGDRRHHAEANACPRCGPRLRFEGTGGPADEAPGLAAAVDALRGGAILAVRGVGGYHLVCDATDAEAVARLRTRKRRPAKPLAVMVADVAAARALAEIDAAEEALLCGPEAPIVLLRRRAAAPLPEAIAPGLPWVGLLLAYTPLHHLLLEGVGRPLVATSANPSGEPIVYRREDAARLEALVDGFLHHDREITAPCDDSVARVIDGRPALLRRSRGYAPRPLRLPEALPEPVLACGAELSNTFCLARGDRAWASQHLGDLGSPESADAYEQAVERMERWLGTRAAVVAHDLHPGYTSTRYAVARDARLRIPVQHHHAHVASAIAEHRLAGPVVGVVFDGTGLGTDGTAWGGELLLADAAGFERLATLRPILLAGGEAAIREVWRLGLAVLEDAFDGAAPLEALPLFRSLRAERIDGVRELLRRGVSCLPAHGAGRWFDALGAIVLDRPTAAHSGDVATRWNGSADPRACRPYPFDLRAPEPRPGPDAPQLELDLRPLVRAAVRDKLADRPAAEISGRFHATLAAAVTAALERLRATLAGRPVVLSGGCFQNALLSEQVAASLGRRGWAVHRHERVPPGDGGLALGQALVAAAALRRGVRREEDACVSAFRAA